jgi:hypothetical protein
LHFNNFLLLCVVSSIQHVRVKASVMGNYTPLGVRMNDKKEQKCMKTKFSKKCANIWCFPKTALDLLAEFMQICVHLNFNVETVALKELL